MIMETRPCKFCGIVAEMGYKGKYSITFGEDRIEEEFVVCEDCGDKIAREIKEGGRWS